MHPGDPPPATSGLEILVRRRRFDLSPGPSGGAEGGYPRGWFLRDVLARSLPDLALERGGSARTSAPGRGLLATDVGTPTLHRRSISIHFAFKRVVRATHGMDRRAGQRDRGGFSAEKLGSPKRLRCACGAEFGCREVVECPSVCPWQEGCGVPEGTSERSGRLTTEFFRATCPSCGLKHSFGEIGYPLNF